MQRPLLVAAMFVAVLGYPRAAGAIDCTDLPNPLFVQSGDTQEALVKRLGRALRDNTNHPISLVYRLTGTCSLASGFYTATKVVTSMSYLPSVAEDNDWAPTEPALTCDVDPDEGVDVDVAIGATFIESCDLGAPPAGVALIPGPVQAYLFAVPKLSSQTALTAGEGYMVFGHGENGDIVPWDDETQLFIRTTTKSTLLTSMAALDVPVNKAKGIRFDFSSEVVNALTGSVAPEKAIGILGCEVYDRHRDTLNALAFKAFGQKYAYYPDKTSSSFDKQNVRDGHYTPWSPTVYLTRVDESDDIVDPDAAYLIDMVLGRAVSPAPSFSALDSVVEVGLVPSCAMKVQRALEGAPLAPFDPPEPCHCYFEDQQGVLPDACISCDDDDECGEGKCRHGFCEAR